MDHALELAIDPRLRGGIDCDLHANIANMAALLPYLDGHWADALAERGMPLTEMASYPPNSPFTARADWRPVGGTPAGRRTSGDKPAGDATVIARDVLDRWQLAHGIVHCLAGVQLPFSDDLGAALARGANNWVTDRLLNQDARLRASILVASQNPQLAAAEIERCAGDPRFVQVLLLVMGDQPLGKRAYWPIYEAAARHNLPIGIHAGSAYRHAVTSMGWPSYVYEDYAANAPAFQGQLTSLICEGVFQKFPGLRVVLIESGVTWLPGLLWRLDKLWKGVRTEIPWVDRLPSEIVRDHVFLTITPFDAPDDAATVARILDHLGGDDGLLFASDYPHWQFDGDAVLPRYLPDATVAKIMHANPLRAYPRLGEAGDPPLMKMGDRP
jgi:predicted TIM-barrel fold metal-dependent hydrolase